MKIMTSSSNTYIMKDIGKGFDINLTIDSLVTYKKESVQFKMSHVSR